LLSEIGENIVVILSTHIVDDVSDLCSNMAIISEGEVLLTGEPLKVIKDLQGKIWKKTIDKRELADYQSRFKVISTRLFAGKTVIHIFSATQADSAFEVVEAGLDDVYFSTLAKA
jgi:ABC-type multidrug transport system ATPase subunit